ncbi:MAG: phosphoribosylanthranilate isomerase [Oscillospiraceae bacterium]|nr:phosphoribosylanthranilate isomerase [Oscillospiraceae bacterium]
MTKIKLCGLTRACDIQAANELLPSYIGFVFAPQSRRYLSPQKAAELKKQLHPQILAAGVFVNEAPHTVAKLLNDGVCDLAQLHGDEDESYIRLLRSLTPKPAIKAFCIASQADVAAALTCTADYVLLDSGAGTGSAFDWGLIRQFDRPYFLAGGLGRQNVRDAIETLHPYAVDVSSGIETDGVKDLEKMEAFVRAVKSADGKEAIQ